MVPKLRVGIILLGLLLAVIMPAAAQDQSIVDVAIAASQGEQPEFTVLVEAVVAASAKDGYGLRTMIQEVAASDFFIRP